MPTSGGQVTVAVSAAPGTTTTCVGYAVGASTATSAGTYSATVVYTAIPVY